MVQAQLTDGKLARGQWQLSPLPVALLDGRGAQCLLVTFASPTLENHFMKLFNPMWNACVCTGGLPGITEGLFTS